MSLGNGRSDLVDIPGQVFEESGTEKAFRFHDGTITVWLPRSLCEWDPSDKTMGCRNGLPGKRD